MKMPQVIPGPGSGIDGEIISMVGRRGCGYDVTLATGKDPQANAIVFSFEAILSTIYMKLSDDLKGVLSLHHKPETLNNGKPWCDIIAKGALTPNATYFFSIIGTDESGKVELHTLSGLALSMQCVKCHAKAFPRILDISCHGWEASWCSYKATGGNTWEQ